MPVAIDPLKVQAHRCQWPGRWAWGVYAKDVILHIIGHLGVHGGVGYAYEYGGDGGRRHVSMEERMTVCNMSIEGGARVGYVNPDQTTYRGLHRAAVSSRRQGRRLRPRGVEWWELASPRAMLNADYDSTWSSHRRRGYRTDGHLGNQSGTGRRRRRRSCPTPDSLEGPGSAIASVEEALAHHEAPTRTRPSPSTPIDVAFIGSCTNCPDLSDLREAAKRGGRAGRVANERQGARGARIAAQVAQAGRGRGTCTRPSSPPDSSGAQAGCSMCLAMNPDKLQSAIRSAPRPATATSKGGQGSPTGPHAADESGHGRGGRAGRRGRGR